MPSATVTSKGQITVPKGVREALGVQPGDRLAFRVGADGTVTVEAETVDVRSLRGMIKSAVRGVSIDDMSEAVRRSGGRK
jgi:AbrB family looped-hinge helix DNA binding protein